MARQPVQNARQRSRHGVETRDHEEVADVDDVVIAESVAVDLDLQEPDDQIGAGLGFTATELDLTVETVRHVAPGLIAVGGHLLGRFPWRRGSCSP